MFQSGIDGEERRRCRQIDVRGDGQRLLLVLSLFLHKAQFLSALPKEFAEFLAEIRPWKIEATFPSTDVVSGRLYHFCELFLRPGVSLSFPFHLFGKRFHCMALPCFPVGRHPMRW